MAANAPLVFAVFPVLLLVVEFVFVVAEVVLAEFVVAVAWNAFAPHAIFGPIASGLATPVLAYTPHW